MKDHDPVNSPSHYTHGKYEVIDVIEAFAADDFHVGNAIKYILRWKFKGGAQDLRKAIWYLTRRADIEEAKEAEAKEETDQEGKP